MSGIRLRIFAACFVFVALISALFAFRAQDIRDEGHAAAVAELSGQTLALKALTVESLGRVEDQLRVIAARVRAAKTLDSEEISDIAVVFAARRGHPSYLVGMAVVDTMGVALHAAHAQALKPLADRDYFVVHRSRPDSGTQFGEVEESEVLTNLRYFTMSRRLETRDGHFAGIVVAYLDVEVLAWEYERLRARPENSLALIAANGRIVTHTPFSNDVIGQTVPLRARRIEGAPAVFRQPKALDGAPRLVVHRWLDPYPFVVSTSLTEDAVHARSRRELPQLTSIWSIVTALILGSGYLLARQTGRISEAREMLGRTGRELDFYKYALDHHAIVSITDESGKIVYVNDKLCEISKYTREELLGHNNGVLNCGCHSEAFFGDIRRSLNQGQAWHGEICSRAKDGSLFWMDTLIVPFLDERGKPFRYFAIRLDITPRKQLETALLAAIAEAEAANRVKSELIANTSHELRTPLNAVIGFSGVMKDELFGPMPPKYREYAADIYNAGRHLLRIVNDILDVSAIEADKLELHEERVDLAESLKSAVRLIRPRAEAGAIELGEDIPEGLPRLFADERRLKQIALNLLANAIKFNAPGGSVAVSAGLAADGGLFFRIADTGIGMDEAEIAVAMTKFGQVDSSLARKHEGTGLGLPLAHSLVELHGGRFAIESAKGKGTTVTVAFPKERTVGG